MNRNAENRNQKFIVKTDLHAEQDAIGDASRNAISLVGSTAYITGPPCSNCFPLLLAVGVHKIVYVGTMEKVYKADTCVRFRKLAAERDVEIIDDMCMPRFEDCIVSCRPLKPRDDIE